MSEVTSDRAFMRHVRANNYCMKGARTFWRDRGMDWSDFLANGISCETLLETGDPRAIATVKSAREEQRGKA